MRRKFVYPDGLPFSAKLYENLMVTTRPDVPCIYDRLMVKKMATAIVVDGCSGSGKTTMAAQIAKSLSGYKPFEYETKRLDYDVQYAYGGAMMEEKLHECYAKGYHVLIYDEGNDLSKRAALSKFNSELNRVFDTFRVFKVLLILCVNNIHYLDTYILDTKVVRALIHIKDKHQEAGYNDFSAYSLDAIYYIKEKMSNSVVKPLAYNSVFPNFHGHSIDLPPEEAQYLEDLTLKYKGGSLVKSSIALQGYKTIPEIALTLNKSTVWVRQKIKAKNFKPMRVHLKKFYFDKNIIEELI